MKITEIRTYLVQVGPRQGESPTTTERYPGGRNWLFVKVMTDEGLYGVGECSGWPRVVRGAVKEFEQILIGEDPANIDLLWAKMFSSAMSHGMLGTVGGGALSGIEMALWDLKGKALGQPVWNLLGGKFRDRVALYGHARSVDAAQRLLDRGYGGMKVSFMGNVDIDLVYAIRNHIGDQVDLMVDAGGPAWMTPSDAIAICRSLEDAGLLFYEDAVAPENLDALARVRDAVSMPLAAGERVSNIWGFRPYIERELVDVIQPDTGRAGGITQMRKVAAMAEAHFISFAPHSGSLGPVAEFAALHVMATIPNALMIERVEYDWEMRDALITPPPVVTDGYLTVPDAPGLGVDIIEEEIVRYPSHGNLLPLPPDDGRHYALGTAGESAYFQARRGIRSRLRRSAADG